MNKIKLISESFERLGYKIIYWNEKSNANGPDCFVQKDNKKPKSVEIKNIKINKVTKAISIPKVSTPRRNDDFIAIVLNDYVLIEPMKDHLKLCSKDGSRAITGLI